MADDRPGYSFDPGPPPEASRFLRNKGYQPAFSFLDVEPEEHAVAFTVAKAMEVDLLTDIRAAVQTALDEGQTLEQFKKSLTPTLQQRGWWGKQIVDGEEVQLGSPRRLKTIYDANLRSARSAGQWERIERTKDALPYLLYQLGPSERHRPHHANKQGLVLHVNDPFWVQWMPPNGWGCKCWVRQITRAEAERRGIDDSPVIDAIEWVNPRTGETQWVPQGLDPSWSRNPGLLRVQAMEDLLDAKLTDAPEMVARVALRDMATSWRVQRLLQGNADGAVPIAILPPDIATEVGTSAVFVKATNEYGAKLSGKAAAPDPETLGRVAEALIDGPLALETGTGAPKLVLYVAGEQPWEVVIKVLPEELWLNTVHRTTLEKWSNRLRKRTLLR